MLAWAAYAALTLALGGGLWRIVSPRQDRDAPRQAVTAALMALLAAQALGWCWNVRVPGPYELSTPPSFASAAARAAAGAACGLAAFASVSPALASEGLFVGLLLALLGAQAAAWLRLFQAWRLMGWFSGTFFAALTPAALAATCGLVTAALRLPEFRGWRWPVAAAALLLWAAPVRLAAWRLRETYHLRAPSLSADAGAPTTFTAERVSLAWLYPWGGRSVRFEERQATVLGVDASPETLEKIERYLRARDLRSVFAKQALGVLRQGWLFWWEGDRALDVAMLHRPGWAPPDYKTALNLLRSGPIDETRYRRLEQLAETARARKQGFEDVSTSQFIFEGFASAYARFGDEKSARPWLLRIDNLWPIYDKKIEITPVEMSHDGRIAGTLLLDGWPATGVKVGLFYVAASTAASPPVGWLSQSNFPDGQGRFSFDALAPGAYYLGLMGMPAQLRGRVLNAPGLIPLTAEVPAVFLDPIKIEN